MDDNRDPKHILLMNLVRTQVALMNDDAGEVSSKSFSKNPNQWGLKVDSVDDWEVDDWEPGEIGNFIPLSVVQQILDQLHIMEEAKKAEKAAVCIQAAYRGWRCRKAVLWDPNTEIGRYYALRDFYDLSLRV